MYNPAPTMANTPPGINGHQVNARENIFEITVINIHPSANQTSIVPVCCNPFEADGSFQAKNSPVPIVETIKPGINSPICRFFVPHNKKTNPIASEIEKTKVNRVSFGIKKFKLTAAEMVDTNSAHHANIFFMTANVKNSNNHENENIPIAAPIKVNVL